MQNPLLASRYAKSLFELASEMKLTEQVLADAEYIQAVIASSAEFAQVLRSPILKSDKKLSVLKAVLGNNIQQLTDKFLQLLVQKGREAQLQEIMDAYVQQYRQANKIKTVTLTTASAMGQELEQILTRRLTEVMPGYQFKMNSVVNPELIGGFMLEMDDKIVDASIRHDLNEVKKQFSKNLYEMAIR